MRSESFLDTILYIKPLFPINKQFNILFLIENGHHWDISLIVHIPPMALAPSSLFAHFLRIVLAMNFVFFFCKSKMCHFLKFFRDLLMLLMKMVKISLVQARPSHSRSKRANMVKKALTYFSDKSNRSVSEDNLYTRSENVFNITLRKS